MKTVDKNKIAAEFGAFIREAREKQGLLQVDIAEQLGVGRPYYSHIESGSRNVYFTTALNICNILGLDIRDFAKRLK